MGRVWIFGRARRSAHMESERASHQEEEAEGGWNSALMIQRRFLLSRMAWAEAGVVLAVEPLVEEEPVVSQDDRVCVRPRLR
jgi:hypothetical protein